MQTLIPTYELKIYQGDDEVLKFRHLADGELVDLTGYAIELECLNPELSRTAVLSDNIGEYSFEYASSETASTQSRLVEYEVVYTIDSVKSTKFRGFLKIIPEVVSDD